MDHKEKLTNQRLESILADGIPLKDAKFFLERAGGRISGHVVSLSFRKKRDHQRQQMIWDALEAALGDEAVSRIGLLLAYTPEEWNIGGSEDRSTGKTAKVG